MNRLVLVGNGYDLAAGLKTSYEHFLVDYFKGMIKMAADVLKQGELNDYKEDEIIAVEGFYYDLSQEIYDSEIDSISNINQFLNHDKIRFTQFDSMESWQDKTRVRSADEPNRFDVTIHSNLLQQLLGDYNWRDIESFYFQKLVSIFDRIESTNRRNVDKGVRRKLIERDETNLKQLNYEFESIKNKLAEYIGKVSEPINNLTNSEPLSCFKRIVEPLDEEKVFKRFFNNDKVSTTKVELEKVFIVNFNYTPNFNTHFFKGLFNEDNIEVVNIHGYFEKPEEIIFGYGDDSHPSYEKLEASGNDEYLKHIKSFHYPHSKSYINLMNFIESDQFEVQIIGHSLGLSDRVLLKSIFEHENCKMIKIYHRGNKKDMIHKYMALSRHCSDKAAMRRKILEYDEKDVVNKENQ